MPVTGFFHVDCALTLHRLYCFFVTGASSRYVHIPGVTANPDRPWTTQQIRKSPDRPGEHTADSRFLARDRARQFTAPSGAVPAGAGTEVIKIPPRSPHANAHAQRFVLTARTEVTDPMLIPGERHLRLVMAEYARHHNRQQPHRSRQLHPPVPDHPAAGLSQMRVKRRPVPGGLLNEDERAA